MFDRLFNKKNKENAPSAKDNINKPPLEEKKKTEKETLSTQQEIKKNISETNNVTKIENTISVKTLDTIDINSLHKLSIHSGLGGNKTAYTNTVQLANCYQEDKTSNYIIKLKNNNHTLHYPVLFQSEMEKHFTLLDSDDPMDDSHIYLNNIMRDHLGFAKMEGHIDKVELFKIDSKDKTTEIKTIDFTIHPAFNKDKRNYIVKPEDLEHSILETLKDYSFMPQQAIYIQNPYNPNIPFCLYINSINGITQLDLSNKSKIPRFSLSNSTEFQFTVAKDFRGLNLAKQKPKITLDFVEKGIGGHKLQLERLLQSAFFSRALSNEYVKAYGIKHNKGILLYGPPGTGKTLIAREIGKLFNKDNITIINGPEIKNKYYGQAQQNLRDRFQPAIDAYKQKGEDSELFVVIIDEIDAIAKERDSGSSGNADNDLTTTLLTLIDGVDSPSNILVIGMTNRKDLIDPAILRPGRLSIHIEISLPDLEGLLEILQIHTKDMRNSGLLASDVDLAYWAKKTENYSGAEIQQLVKIASEHAMANNFDSESNTLKVKKEIKQTSQLSKVTQQHFEKAFSEITPAFGINKKNFHFDPKKFIDYSPEITNALTEFKSNLEMITHDDTQNQFNYLISGEKGIGKTDLAKYLASNSDAKYIKVISADKLLSMSLQQQVAYLDKEFSNARQSERSVIILEDIENILEADSQLINYSNLIRLKLDGLLKNRSDAQNKMIVIATTCDEDFIKQIKLDHLFHASTELHSVCLDLTKEKDKTTLSAIAASLGFNMIQEEKSIDLKKAVIDLPIQQLILKMKRFCVDTTRDNSIKLSDFVTYLQKDSKSSLTSTLFKLSSTSTTLSSNTSSKQLELKKV